MSGIGPGTGTAGQPGPHVRHRTPPDPPDPTGHPMSGTAVL